MRPTGRGWALLVVVGALLAAGVGWGMPLLRALAGCGAAALLVALVPGMRRIRPTARREVYPDRVQRGEPAVARLTVVNETGRRMPALVAYDTVGADLREVPVRALPAGATTWQVYDLPTQVRGRIVVGPLVVERSDLLGLARSRTPVGEPVELWVHPRRHPVRLPRAGRARNAHDGAPLRGGGRGDLLRLREYVPGDPLRHLHWKATARTGSLMVREMADPAEPWCLVLLDDRAGELAAQAFEEAVELTASILVQACEEGRRSRLATVSGLRIDVAGGMPGARDVLDRLCVLDQVPAAPPAAPPPDASRGAGWFVHVGGTPSALVGLQARRYGQATLFDLGAGEPAPGTVRAGTAVAALRIWNAAGRP